MSYNIGVLISGDGSNLNAIINNGINVKFVVSDNPDAAGLLIAKKNHISVFTFKNLLILEAEVSKMQNRPLFAPALAKVKQKIQKLRDEDNTITY